MSFGRILIGFAFSRLLPDGISICSPSRFKNLSPQVVVVQDADDVDRLRALASKIPEFPELLSGPEALIRIAVAPEVDTVMSSIVGVAGLAATYEAVCAGKRVGLANKEVLVSGGKLVMDAVRRHGAELIPVDSEHNGAHQCLRAGLAQRSDETDPDRFRWSVPDDVQGSSGLGDAGRCVEASYLEDGQPHHDRFGHADEQGI